MKNRIVKLSVLFLLLGITSCEMEMNSPEVTIVPVESEYVKKIDNTIYVLKNSPLYFSLSGNPDNITFWSGEWMHAYANRSRVFIEQPIEAELSFSVSRQYGNWKPYGGPYGTFLRLYYTTDPLVLEHDFEKDSKALRDADWIEMLDKNNDPADPTVDRTGKAFLRSYDMADIKGPFRIAFQLRYPKNPDDEPGGNTPTYTVTDFNMENTLPSGKKMKMSASEFGLQPIFMNYKDYASYYSEKIGKEPYKTFDPFWSYVKTPPMPTTQYLWNLNSVASASQSFAFGGGSDNKNPLYTTTGFETWLYSAEIDLGKIEIASDTGIAIKEISDRLDSYRYYYKETGKYKATFVPSSANIEGSKIGQIIEFDIEVVDELPQ